MDLRTKFQKMGEALRGQFAERDDVINGMLCAALAGEHVLLVGPPGTAKSALVVAFTKLVHGATHFEWLLGKFTVPEELFGPVSLKALKEEKYKRVTTGKLPEAHVGFLDEVFKANSAILNTLLPVMNERKFYNNGGATQIPLRMMVGASNELPDGAELGALYDRFLVRFWVDYLDNVDSWVDMLTGQLVGGPASITLEEWDAARKEVEQVQFEQALAREIHKIRQKLAKDHGLQLSDRRWRQCVGLLRAAAWLSGESSVIEDHLVALVPALWNEREQIDKVREVVEAAAGATLIEAKKIADLIGEMISKLPATAAGDKVSVETQKEMVTINREGTRAISKLRQLQTEARTQQAKAKVGEALAAVEGKLNPMRQQMRETLGL